MFLEVLLHSWSPGAQSLCCVTAPKPSCQILAPFRLLKGSAQMEGHQDLALSLLRTKAPAEILSALFLRHYGGMGSPSAGTC